METEIVLLSSNNFLNSKPGWYVTQINLEDELISNALHQFGFKGKRKSWDADDLKINNPRIILFRTPWDYFDRFNEFFEWFNITATHSLFINSAEIINWNLDKHYLFDLQKNDITISESHLIEKGSRENIEHLFEKTGWPKAIVKPCISGAARDTYLISNPDQYGFSSRFSELLSRKSLLFQQFEDEILTEGEISIVCFGKNFSHAVRKIPKDNDFRVQDDHGGRVELHRAQPDEIEFAMKCIGAIPFETPVYSRVDFVRKSDGNLILMELELFEPELFIRFQPESATLLAREITTFINKKKGHS